MWNFPANPQAFLPFHDPAGIACIASWKLGTLARNQQQWPYDCTFWQIASETAIAPTSFVEMFLLSNKSLGSEPKIITLSRNDFSTSGGISPLSCRKLHLEFVRFESWYLSRGSIEIFASNQQTLMMKSYAWRFPIEKRQIMEKASMSKCNPSISKLRFLPSRRHNQSRYSMPLTICVFSALNPRSVNTTDSSFKTGSRQRHPKAQDDVARTDIDNTQLFCARAYLGT